MNTDAIIIFAFRFTLDGNATERKIIRTGIATKNIATIRKAHEISNVNTFPARMSSMVSGIYK